jgi:desulfoferrodoxin (superoxide reductase-like protein)
MQASPSERDQDVSKEANMAAEGMPVDNPIVVSAEKVDHTGKFIAIFVVLGLLIIGEIYFMTRLGSLRTELRASQAQLAKKLNGELSAQVQQLANANAQSLEQLRSSLDDTATQMSATEKRALARAHYASYLVRRLRKQENRNAQELRQEIAKKADQQQVGSLSQDVSSTKSDLAAAKTTMNTLASDLGMARSRLGTLIATNHNDIVALQKQGHRDYYEFELTKNHKKVVAGVGLVLKKSNTKHHIFNVDMVYNDMMVTRKDLAIDSPVFFAPRYAHQFYELVVYQLAPGWVKGYISTPKGALTQVTSTPNTAVN